MTHARGVHQDRPAPSDPAGHGTSGNGFFRSLKVRNYLLFASGQVVSTSGTWMGRVAQDWIVLELTDNSAVALGVAMALQFGPMLLLSLWGGLLADRYPRRTLLLIIQAALGVSSALLAGLVLSGTVQLWHVYATCLFVGVLSAVEQPTRHAFVSEMVPPAEVPNAVALNSLTLHGSRILGPAIAGILIATVGTGLVFAINALSYMAVLAGLAAMRTTELRAVERRVRARGELREGLRYVRSEPTLVLALALLAVVGTLGANFEVSLAIYAKVVLEHEATSYGAMHSAMAVGAVLAALGFARRRQAPSPRFLIGTTLTFGIIEIGLGLTTSYVALLVLLVPQGVAMLGMLNNTNTTLQLGSDPAMRGRVMGLYSVALHGGKLFGGPLMGWIADTFGGRAPLLAGGGACVLAAGLAALVERMRATRPSETATSTRSRSAAPRGAR